MHDDDFDQRVAATLKAFQLACDERGFLVTPDGRVSEAAAADLLGYAPRSLANMRVDGVGPPAYRRAAGPGSRCSYRVDELAHWLESGREEPLDLHLSPQNRT